MSRIDELIERLCPDGVSFVALEELCEKTTNIKWREAGAAEYSYIDLTSVDIRLRRIVDTSSVNAGNAPSRAQQIVQTGDVVFATTRPTQMRVCVIPQEYDGQICSTGFCVLRPSRSITTNYLMHVLGTADFCKYLEDNQTMGNYPAISNKKLLKYRIPVPPIEIQQEIVRVLDSFAELEAELEARNRQYAYYRNQLLRYICHTSIKRVPLGQVAHIGRGDYITRKDIVSGEVPVILGGTEPAYYHSASNHDGEGIVISRSGVNAGFVTYWNKPIFVSDGFILDASEAISCRYLYYVLKNDQDVLNALKRGSGVPHINGKMLHSYLVPVPPLDEQARVIAILDKFDALVNDISQGLPAEIAARRKQYAYYRDKLLSIKEKTV